jgi:biotin transport system substrate-specific component
MLGVTAGYLIAFPVAALISGYIKEQMGTGRLAILCSAVSGLAVILASGTFYLALFFGLGIARAASLGLLPFIGGEAIKAAIAVILSGRR